MNYEKNKSSNILKGRGFYLILALCLIGIGIGAFVAYNKIQQGSYTEPDPSLNLTSQAENPAPQNTESPVPSADSVDTEKKDEPYENKEPKAEQPAPVANNFVMPIEGNVQKHFSNNTLVYSATYKDMRLHNGADIAASQGSAVKSCGGGTVVAIIEDTVLGKYVEVDHGNNIVARYCGLDQIAVKKDDKVSAATTLGTLGTVNDECLDQPHLHLEFYKDEIAVDPLSIIYPQ